MKIIKLKTNEEVTKYLAELLLQQIESNPKSVLGLATGSTPTLAYHQLVKKYLVDQTDFSQVITFNLDEYIGIEPENKNSYRSFMNENLFNYININQENTFLPSTDDQNYAKYDDLIKEYGGIDLQILGIGENGHIGFNEPGTKESTLTHKVTLAENTRENNSIFFDSLEDVPKEAVTMGITSILNAKKIILAATKSNKAEIIKRLINNDISENLPASFLKKHPNVIILVDEDSGKYIEEMI
ncbi:Glucosamine-6-phosphate deaminase 1 [Candidatus Izimaplasma bacterium HR1]|jgi:glucosamine-6-phosphate deaminase|uniref:glucosamine-6-phosphate deaminase n=1 Tax=Candidatus Izimoplasma sp. HR1 TaxID=1541959 RepID=UPI0004F5A199|nr:Glucosamine-6-phosphate deaminase 1 [Candidatus Izimaplasma bacterium HR1]